MSELPSCLQPQPPSAFRSRRRRCKRSRRRLKMTLFGQPSVNNDSIWMAIEKGFYQQEGLDVTYRLFPSGTTAFQAFQTGQGDIVMTGDLPSVQYFFRVKGDYRTIAVIERDAKGYVAVARKEHHQAAGPDRQDDRDAGWIDGLMVHLRVPDQERRRYVEGGGQESGYAGAARGAVRRRDRRLLHLAAGRLAHARDLSGQGALSRPTRPVTSRAIWSPAPVRNGLQVRTGQETSQSAGCARPSRAAMSRKRTLPRVAAYAKAKLDLSENGDPRAVGHQYAPARARQDLLRRFLQSQPLGAGREDDRAER